MITMVQLLYPSVKKPVILDHSGMIVIQFILVLINIFVSLHNICMSNKTYSLHYIICLCLKNIFVSMHDIIMSTGNAMKLTEVPKIYTTE